MFCSLFVSASSVYVLFFLLMEWRLGNGEPEFIDIYYKTNAAERCNHIAWKQQCSADWRGLSVSQISEENLGFTELWRQRDEPRQTFLSLKGNSRFYGLQDSRHPPRFPLSLQFILNIAGWFTDFVLKDSLFLPQPWLSTLQTRLQVLRRRVHVCIYVEEWLWAIILWKASWSGGDIYLLKE